MRKGEGNEIDPDRSVRVEKCQVKRKKNKIFPTGMVFFLLTGPLMGAVKIMASKVSTHRIHTNESTSSSKLIGSKNIQIHLLLSRIVPFGCLLILMLYMHSA